MYLGGHWSLTFAKPVYWMMKRGDGEPFKTKDAKYGTVYRVRSAEELWRMVRAEGGYAYQTHPRTKGSTGYPDAILGADYFRDPQYFGTGWKAMPSDLSLPELGARGFKVVDDLNNLGLHKVMLGEVDMFQMSTADELYGGMNVNYVRLDALPDLDHYDALLKAVSRGEGFISTGEVLMPRSSIKAVDGDALTVRAEVTSTFPLRVADVVWGDGRETHTERFDLTSTHEFEQHAYEWKVKAPGWKWARISVWDVAGGGAFTNPVWR